MSYSTTTTTAINRTIKPLDMGHSRQRVAIWKTRNLAYFGDVPNAIALLEGDLDRVIVPERQVELSVNSDEEKETITTTPRKPTRIRRSDSAEIGYKEAISINAAYDTAQRKIYRRIIDTIGDNLLLTLQQQGVAIHDGVGLWQAVLKLGVRFCGYRCKGLSNG